MVELWRRVFSSSRVAITAESNFFDAGGDSLLAARLFDHIKRDFAAVLPLSSLFQAATPRSLARVLAEGKWAAPWLSLTPVRKTGTRPPLFLIHGGGGDVLTLGRMVNYLRADRPLYCVQAKGLDGREHPISTVEGMAQHYIDSIRRELAFEGPWLVAGHSFGAVVAYEMGQRLRAAGEVVPFVGLFDCPSPDLKPGPLQLLRSWLMLVAGQPWRQVPGFVWDNVFWHLKTALARRKSGAAVAESGTVGVLEAAVGALECYRVRRYPGRLFLFRAGQTTSTMRTHSQGGWEADEGVDVIEVPGDHMTILEEPNVRFLAEAIERTLDSLQLQPALHSRSCSARS